ncbi:MAG TPA: AMP-binding protein, partial [Candidatus Polarisedimenticolia bacterium]|nr:AMP-binding protein [Candidatus Polarisedimenticolia bacterium]
MWREGVRWRRRTYGELHRRTLSCASALAELGARPGRHVLIQGPDSPDWVEAFLAAQWLGAVAVPLEADTTADLRSRVAAMVGGGILVAPPGTTAPAGLARLDWGGWGTGAAAPPAPAAASPADTAEVIFTSGTTADPKGVVLTHGNILSDFAPIERGFRKRERLVRMAGRRLRFLSSLPFSHMFGQAMGIFLPLSMGLTVALVAPRPAEALDAARRLGCWGLFTVPRVMELMALELRRIVGERGSLDRFERRQQAMAGRHWLLQAMAFPGVQRLLGWRFRLFVAGGAGLDPEVRSFWERCGYLVVQGYGLTEAAPIVSLSNPFDRRASGVGRPLGNVEVRIGEDGEVLVRGPNVTPGYLGGGGAVAGQEWLRTGDRGALDERGRLTIEGRLKDVIVTAEGDNVHPADVEAVLARMPGVLEACVVGLPAGTGERVHAVLRMREAGLAEEAVRRANERLLPKQRIRGHTVWPEADFPRTAIGKVRKGIVRERAAALQAGRTPGAPAGGAGPAARLVARIARRDPMALAGSCRLGDDLGLGSLDMVELGIALEQEYGLAVPEEELASATVGSLEARLAGALSEPVPASPPAAGGAAA